MQTTRRTLLNQIAAAATLGLVAASTPLVAAPLPRLKVSDNHRFLVTADGQPFF